MTVENIEVRDGVARSIALYVLALCRSHFQASLLAVRVRDQMTSLDVGINAAVVACLSAR